jgi:hypothetical protein
VNQASTSLSGSNAPASRWAIGAQASTVRASMFTKLSRHSSEPSWPSVSQQKSSSDGTSSTASMIMLRLRLW